MVVLEPKAAEPARNAPGRILSARVLAWAMYDLGNTIFSMNVVTLYLALWVVNHQGGSDSTWGYANSLSMLLVFLTAPLLGAMSDRVGKRLPFLLASTLLCVGATVFLGSGGLAVTLALFVFANFFFQAGLIFYDATLPLVSTAENRGRVGGLGIGIGYLGSLIGVAAGLTLLDRIGFPALFRITAALFLLFALPIFLFVREPQPRAQPRATLREAVRQIGDTFRNTGQYPGLRRFLLGRVFYTDAANTLIIFMGVFVTNEIGFSERGAQLVSLSAILGAIVGGLAMGFVVDQIGPRRALNMVLVLWMVVLSAAVVIAIADLPGSLFWGVAALAGAALGGTWAADRPYMLLLSPPDRLGEFYGLYSMVGRFAAVVGPALWALIADTLGWGRPAAVAGLLVMVIIAFFILRGVGDRPRPSGG